MNPDSTAPPLEISELAFSYPGGSIELWFPALSLSPGERVALAGESGAGKTTLLHLAAGILRPGSGKITSCGTDLTDLPDSQRRAFRIAHLGLVFQEFELLDYLSVLENILLPYRINRALKLNEEVRKRARDLAGDLGLTDLLDRRPKQLSHGQRQRVAVCRALVTRPQLVLADEPTANLDPDNRGRVLAAFDRYLADSGAALILTTHDEDVQACMDRTIKLNEKGEGHER